MSTVERVRTSLVDREADEAIFRDRQLAELQEKEIIFHTQITESQNEIKWRLITARMRRMRNTLFELHCACAKLMGVSGPDLHIFSNVCKICIFC